MRRIRDSQQANESEKSNVTYNLDNKFSLMSNYVLKIY